MPIETIDAAPVWDPTTSFEWAFEDDGRGRWDASSYTTSTTNPLEGLECGVFGSTQYALKRLNSMGRLYLRFSYRMTAVSGDRDILVVGNGGADVIELLFDADYGGVANQITIGETGQTPWARWTYDTVWHTVELFIHRDDKSVTIWLDGNEVSSETLAAATVADYYTLTVGNSGASSTTFVADCIKVDSFRVGLPGAITPRTEQSTTDVEIDGQGYSLFQNQYQEEDISGFAPRLGTGDVGYSDLSGFQHFYVPSFNHGFGQTEMTGVGQGDVAAFAKSSNADTTGVGIARGWNTITTRGTITVAADLNDIDTRITGTAVGSTAVFGIGFPAAKASAAYVSLLKITDAAATSTSFTSTLGVRDVLYNGAYTFATLGGARMQKSTDLSSWTDAGQATATDMGRMAMFQGFLWVADRSTPILCRAGESDASDLDKPATVAPPSSNRVGPGSVPINSLCPYLGRLYVGREDGLYYVTQDTDIVNASVVETFPRSAYNCRDMVVHNGYLVYTVGSRIYRFSGESKQDITPGPIDPHNSLPVSIRYWLSLTVINGYLYAWGYASAGTYLMVYNGSGWHLMDDAGAADGVGVVGCQSVSDEPRAYYVQIYNDTGTIKAKVASASSLLGDERPITSSYETAWTIDTPWYSMGMPSVPKMFRMVRLLCDDLPAYAAGETPYVTVTYWVKTPQGEETGEVGRIIQRDSDFVMFNPGVIGNKIRLRITVSHPATKPIVVRGLVIQYIDRPEPVWGYTMSLNLSETPRNYVGEGGQTNAQQLKQHLRDARAKESYVRMRDRDGGLCDGFISSGPRFTLVGDMAIARLTFMVVKRYVNTPPASGGVAVTVL